MDWFVHFTSIKAQGGRGDRVPSGVGRIDSVVDRESRVACAVDRVLHLLQNLRREEVRRIQRPWLQGATGDALHALCCAVGYNLRWLLRAVVRLGLKGLLLSLFGLAYWALFAARRLPQIRIGNYVAALKSGFTPKPALAPAPAGF